VAGFGQPWSLGVEEGLEDRVALEQFFSAAGREDVRIYLLYRLHLQPVKPVPAK
jgi:hypothetical protein